MRQIARVASDRAGATFPGTTLIRASALGTLALGCVAPFPALATSSFTIRTSEGYVARIGAFHPSRDPHLAAAINVFGQPSSRDLDHGSCRVEWRRLRLRINFENFGGHGPGETTCTPSVGRAQSFSVRGSHFRTWRGLRVGARSQTILDRHRSAEFRANSWWLRTAVSPFGDEREYAVVSAVVKGGRVRVIAGWIGGAGE